MPEEERRRSILLLCDSSSSHSELSEILPTCQNFLCKGKSFGHTVIDLITCWSYRFPPYVCIFDLNAYIKLNNAQMFHALNSLSRCIFSNCNLFQKVKWISLSISYTSNRFVGWYFVCRKHINPALQSIICQL